MDQQTEAISEFQKGMLEGLRAAENIARADLRVDLAKSCGFIPGWQRGRWLVADDISGLIDKLHADGPTP